VCVGVCGWGVCKCVRVVVVGLGKEGGVLGQCVCVCVCVCRVGCGLSMRDRTEADADAHKDAAHHGDGEAVRASAYSC